MYNLKSFITRHLQIHRSPWRPLEKFLVPFLFLNPLAVAAATDVYLPIVTEASVELPSVPFLVSWCEGKSCEKEFSKQVVCKVAIYQDASLESKKLGDLIPGDSIETRLYYTKILKLGSYLPLEGETKILVSRSSDHAWLSFFGHAWDSENDPKDHVVFPVTEAWAFIKTKKGLTGFVKLDGKGTKACPFKRARAPSMK